MEGSEENGNNELQVPEVELIIKVSRKLVSPTSQY